MLYYVGADFTVSGARSISTLRPSGDPARLSKPRGRGGGRGSGGPKTRQPGQLVSVCLELRCGTATHVALHAASGSASPNASDSPAKCVPNGGFGAVTTQSADFVNGALTKSTVRHSALGAHVRVPNRWFRRAMRSASLTMRPASPCSGPPNRDPGRRLKPHAAAHVAAYVAQHVAAPIWAHLGPRWAHHGPHVWARVWARVACIWPTMGP
jgi:hypothetical protein